MLVALDMKHAHAGDECVPGDECARSGLIRNDGNDRVYKRSTPFRPVLYRAINFGFWHVVNRTGFFGDGIINQEKHVPARDIGIVMALSHHSHRLFDLLGTFVLCTKSCRLLD